MMKLYLTSGITAVWLAAGAMASGADTPWKAGVAKVVITPEQRLWLAGYALREKPAEGKVMELWAKALALEAADGQRAVFVTTDTLGIPRPIYLRVSAMVKERFQINPDHLVLSASHTHCGPVLQDALFDMYPLDDEQRKLIADYSSQFEQKLVDTIGRAIEDLKPARLAAGQGTTAFAVNRRNNPEGEVPKLIEQGTLKGPVDHCVPVLAIYQPDGKLKAVLFGYACHNTVMAFFKWSGDCAGFAQMALEKSHPEATALFFMGCGGDQNPLPRRQLELAERYGQMLASAVEEVLLSPPRTLPAQLKTSLEIVNLDFGPVPTEAELEKVKADPAPAHQRWAARILEQVKSGKPLARTYPYPMQAWNLGGTQLFLMLGGEPVVDYSLRFKHEFGDKTWVAGYCNDVMTYIPSLRVLKEGGYEGGGAMIPYGQPALRWGDNVEELLAGAARRVVERVSQAR